MSPSSNHETGRLAWDLARHHLNQVIKQHQITKQTFYASGTQWRAHNQKVTLDLEEETEIKLNYGTFRNNTWQTFSVQAQIVNMLGFAGYKVSVAAMYLSVVWTGVAVFNPTLFTKTSGGSWPKNWLAHLCSVPWQLFKSLSKISKMPISWKKKKRQDDCSRLKGSNTIYDNKLNAGSLIRWWPLKSSGVPRKKFEGLKIILYLFYQCYVSSVQ